MISIEHRCVSWAYPLPPPHLLFLPLDAQDWTQGLAYTRQAFNHSASTLTLNVALGVTPWMFFCTPWLSHQYHTWAFSDFLLILLRCDLCSRLCLPLVFSSRNICHPYENNWESAFLSGPGIVKWRSSDPRILHGISLGLLVLAISVRKFKENIEHRASETGRVCHRASGLRVGSGWRDHCALIFDFNKFHIVCKVSKIGSLFKAAFSCPGKWQTHLNRLIWEEKSYVSVLYHRASAN